jgi:DNA-binding transcriptional regulator YdaS (Cro superfamily)
MQLSQYFLERGNAKFLAEKLGISKSYLSQMASGKSLSPERAIEIENPQKALLRADCLPERWMNIWPEFTPPRATDEASINQ